MNLKKSLEKLRKVKDVSFATVDKTGSPQVRIIDIMNVEDEKIYFLTGRGKSFYNEINETLEVAIVGLTEDYESIRVNGKVKKMESQKEVIDKLFELNPSMKDVYPGNSRYILDAFCVYEGEVEYFDLLAKPIFRTSFSLNGGKIIKKGFCISDRCIKCGTCYRNCPQKAIVEKETHFEIMQEHCLHCGLCFENCPAKAIEVIK